MTFILVTSLCQNAISLADALQRVEFRTASEPFVVPEKRSAMSSPPIVVSPLRAHLAGVAVHGGAAASPSSSKASWTLNATPRQAERPYVVSELVN